MTYVLPDGYWLAPNELTQPMLSAAGFIAEDNSNRKRWELFKKHAPKVECVPGVDRAAIIEECIAAVENGKWGHAVESLRALAAPESSP